MATETYKNPIDGLICDLRQNLPHIRTTCYFVKMSCSLVFKKLTELLIGKIVTIVTTGGFD